MDPLGLTSATRSLYGIRVLGLFKLVQGLRAWGIRALGLLRV